MNGLDRWTTRAFYLACLILVPFLRFVVRYEYGFLNPEVIAAVALLAVICAVLALAARGIWFYLLTAFCVSVMATYPLLGLAGFLTAVAPPLMAAAIAILTWMIARLMREKFFPVLAVFACSSLLVEGALHIGGTGATVHARNNSPPAHVLWLVLDEQIGLNGYPCGIPECASARERLRGVLEHYHFTVFPNAYSNYPVTADSLPSILSGRLVSWAGELMPRTGPGEVKNYGMTRNPLAERFHNDGYHVVVWQHGAVEICGASLEGVDCRDQREQLTWLHRAPGGWMTRFRRLVGTYQSEDPLLVRVKGFFPFRFSVKLAGPARLEGFWPDGMVNEVAAETQKTLFLAHLLTPHSPYVYREDGSIRPAGEWAGDRADRRVSDGEYSELYRRYCGQTAYLASQVETLLRRLDEQDLLREMTVVIHGDHGSRILHLTRGSAQRDASEGASSVSPELLDYSGAPETRDLLDRFSTLLAVRRPGATAPDVRQEKHSVLTLLSRVIFKHEPQDGVRRSDAVYLVDSRQQFHPIDIQDYWK